MLNINIGTIPYYTLDKINIKLHIKTTLKTSYLDWKVKHAKIEKARFLVAQVALVLSLLHPSYALNEERVLWGKRSVIKDCIAMHAYKGANLSLHMQPRFWHFLTLVLDFAT